jgi:hypothetical protein
VPDDHAGAEADLQDAVAGPDAEEVCGAGAEPRVGARHDEAAQPPEDAPRAAEHAQEDATREAHPPSGA